MYYFMKEHLGSRRGEFPRLLEQPPRDSRENKNRKEEITNRLAELGGFVMEAGALPGLSGGLPGEMASPFTEAFWKAVADGSQYKQEGLALVQELHIINEADRLSQKETKPEVPRIVRRYDVAEDLRRAEEVRRGIQRM